MNESNLKAGSLWHKRVSELSAVVMINPNYHVIHSMFRFCSSESFLDSIQLFNLNFCTSDMGTIYKTSQVGCGIFGMRMSPTELPMVLRRSGELEEDWTSHCLSWHIEPEVPKYIIFKTSNESIKMLDVDPCRYAFVNATMSGDDLYCL